MDRLAKKLTKKEMDGLLKMAPKNSISPKTRAGNMTILFGMQTAELKEKQKRSPKILRDFVIFTENLNPKYALSNHHQTQACPQD